MNTANIAVALLACVLAPFGKPELPSASSCLGVGGLWWCLGSGDPTPPKSITSDVRCVCQCDKGLASVEDTCEVSSSVSTVVAERPGYLFWIGSLIGFDISLLLSYFCIQCLRRSGIRTFSIRHYAFSSRSTPVLQISDRPDIVARAASAVASAGVRVHATQPNQRASRGTA